MSPSTPKWISKKQALYVHDLSIKKHGGLAGIRDERLLDSALTRPRNHFAYGERNLYVLTAIYTQGISKNHVFLDGNKRTAYSVGALFLHFNGFTLKIPSPEKQITFFIDLAAGKVSHDELTLFYQNNTKKIEPH